MYSLDLASSADNHLGSLHGKFGCVTSCISPQYQKTVCESTCLLFCLAALPLAGSAGTEFALARTSMVIAANSYPKTEVLRGGSLRCVQVAIYVLCRPLSFVVLVLNRMVGGQLGAPWFA